MKNLQNTKADIKIDTSKMLLIGIITVATGGLLYFGYRQIKKGIDKSKFKSASNQVDHKSPQLALASILAQRAYAAMVTGFEWWNDWFGDGTNEDELYAIAQSAHAQGVTFTMIADAYRKLYKREFQTDLKDELQSSELSKFYNKLKGLAGLGNSSISDNTFQFSFNQI